MSFFVRAHTAPRRGSRAELPTCDAHSGVRIRDPVQGPPPHSRKTYKRVAGLARNILILEDRS